MKKYNRRYLIVTILVIANIVLTIYTIWYASLISSSRDILSKSVLEKDEYLVEYYLANDPETAILALKKGLKIIDSTSPKNIKQHQYHRDVIIERLHLLHRLAEGEKAIASLITEKGEFAQFVADLDYHYGIIWGRLALVDKNIDLPIQSLFNIMENESKNENER